MVLCAHNLCSLCFSVPFKFVGQSLVITAKAEKNKDKSFGPTEYEVTIVKAAGGRIGGKGRKVHISEKCTFRRSGCHSRLGPASFSCALHAHARVLGEGA